MRELRAILWDVGGPITDDDGMYVLWERGLLEAMRVVAKREVSPDEFAAAIEWSIQSYAPYSFKSILFHLTGRDQQLAARTIDYFYSIVPSHSDTLNTGIVEFLRDLSRQVPMVIVANQLRGLPERLKEWGIESYFVHVISAGEYGLYKPDLRVFQRALEFLKLEPHETLMVGDRLDNDIVPAKLLGIRTLHLRCGWYKEQKIRMPEEQADWTVDSVPAMITRLRELFLQ